VILVVIMSIETEKDVDSMIDDLINQIQKMISAAKKTDQLKPEKTTFRKWVLNDFKYSDNGIESTGATGKEIIKDDWLRIAVVFDQAIEHFESYTNLVTKTKPMFSEMASHVIDNFVTRILRYYLENETWDKSEINKMKQILLKEINNEPVRCGSSVELVGITLRSKKIKITNSVSIRQVTRKDLEIEIPYYSFTQFDHFGSPYPSTILDIEDYSDNAGQLQRKEWLAVAILRLFKVASIRYIRSKMYTDSLRALIGGTMYTHERGNPLNTGVIKESEEKLLQHFWNNIEHKIPKSFIEPSVIDSNYSDIAYHRYTDALLKPGPEEARITNAMMGLESVFLRDDGELQELSYRLRLRVAKLISNFGHDPFEIKKIIQDAYEVRSRFVHGGLLDFKKKEKLAEKYGSMNNLIEKILDFLRLTIIVSIMIDVSKDELVSTIDKSFLDSGHQERLNQLISPAKNILELN